MQPVVKSFSAYVQGVKRRNKDDSSNYKVVKVTISLESLNIRNVNFDFRITN